MNATVSVDRRAHLHVGWNRPGYLPEVEPETFSTFAEAKAHLIGELLAAADSAAGWGEPDGEDLVTNLDLAAQDLDLASGPDWGDIVAGYSWWIAPCSDEQCDLEDGE